MLEQVMVSEYNLIYMNMPYCARTLNLPESAKIYPSVGKCLNMSNIVNMAEYA